MSGVWLLGADCIWRWIGAAILQAWKVWRDLRPWWRSPRAIIACGRAAAVVLPLAIIGPAVSPQGGYADGVGILELQGSGHNLDRGVPRGGNRDLALQVERLPLPADVPIGFTSPILLPDMRDQPTPVPEPSCVLVMLAALSGLAAVRRLFT